jgi:cell wall-associated NlpC family hydrolase
MIAVAWVVVRNLLQHLCIPLTQDELWLWRAGPAGALVTQPNLKPDAPRGAPLRAGDLLFFHDPGSYHHVGIYDGNGNMVHAPRTGKTVEVVHDVFSDPYYAAQFALATRPGGATVVAIGAHG